METQPVTRKGVLKMVEAISGQNGCGKYLKPVLLLSLVLFLLWNSILWAGPMGDPEPVGANDQKVHIGAPADSQPGAQAALTLSNIELAIIVLGGLL